MEVFRVISIDSGIYYIPLKPEIKKNVGFIPATFFIKSEGLCFVQICIPAKLRTNIMFRNHDPAIWR